MHIERPSDFPQDFLAVVMIYSSFKSARYDRSHPDIEEECLPVVVQDYI